MDKSGAINAAFADYADLCFSEFGDRVSLWITFNEPSIVAELGEKNEKRETLSATISNYTVCSASTLKETLRFIFVLLANDIISSLNLQVMLLEHLHPPIMTSQE